MRCMATSLVALIMLVGCGNPGYRYIPVPVPCRPAAQATTDAAISQKVRQLYQQGFGVFDRNRNGWLALRESGMTQEAFQLADGNHDGRLSLREFLVDGMGATVAARLTALLAARRVDALAYADTDDDTMLSRQEYDASVANLAGKYRGDLDQAFANADASRNLRLADEELDDWLVWVVALGVTIPGAEDPPVPPPAPVFPPCGEWPAGAASAAGNGSLAGR